jgi:hypothetical protein
MAETLLRYGPQFRDGGDRYQVVVMADAAVLRSGGEGRCHLDDGPALAPETARRLSCDASLVAMLIGENSEPLDVGRTTQSIPRAIRRALRVRDGGCRFPGCDRRRFTDGHHIRHWADGGPTSLENLITLCRAHHRAIHEGGYRVRRVGPGHFEFTNPDGDVLRGGDVGELPTELDVAELNRRLGLVITSDTGETLWGGERLDLGLAIDAILCLENREAGDNTEGGEDTESGGRGNAANS